MYVSVYFLKLSVELHEEVAPEVNIYPLHQTKQTGSTIYFRFGQNLLSVQSAFQ